MFRRGLAALALVAALAFPALSISAIAQTAPAAQSSSDARIAALEQALKTTQSAAADARTAGDNAWMLISAALVLLMTGPGLALFYGGLVRRKNILGTMMQSFAMMGLVTILWAICGYSLAFGHGNAFIGGFEHAFLRGVGIAVDPNNFYVTTIPEQTYMVYQLMFAIITPALISGAVAGLVAITPASGFVQPMSALAIGLAAGFFCSFMVFKVKSFFGYDDSLDAFGVHGAGGTLGAILTGVFAASVINPVFKDKAGNALPSGMIDGHWGQLLNQLAGVGLAWGISIVGTLALLFLVDKTIGLRMTPEQENEGMDLSQHGEEGYDFNS